MTAPAPPAVADYPYEQLQAQPAVEAVVAALAVYLASRAAISAAQLPTRLIGQLTEIGVAPSAAREAGRLALSVSMAGRTRNGVPAPLADGVRPSITRQVARDEPRMRARYIYNAAVRLTQQLVAGRWAQGLNAEVTYLDAHVRAGRNRRTAALRLDDTFQDEGPVLQWLATLDERTTADCLALHGRFFTLDDPPGIPGAMHPACRCTARGVRFEDSFVTRFAA